MDRRLGKELWLGSAPRHNVYSFGLKSINDVMRLGLWCLGGNYIYLDFLDLFEV